MALTPQREKFARLVADGNTQTDAYRGAFDIKPTTKPRSVQSMAYRLMQNVEVRHRVEELKKELADKELWTREQSLITLIEKALPLCEKPQDYVAVIKELNAMQGFNAPVKTEISGNLEIKAIEKRAKEIESRLFRPHRTTASENSE